MNQGIEKETDESMLSVLAKNLQSIVKKDKPPIILNDFIRIEDGIIKYPENGNEEEIGKKRKASGKYLYHCRMRDKSSMFISTVFKNLIFLCSF